MAVVFSILIAINIYKLFIDPRPLVYQNHSVKIYETPIYVNDFKLMDVRNNFRPIKELKDELTIAAFWAPWCHVCADEFPKINNVMFKLNANNVKLLPVVKSKESKISVKNFYKKLGLNEIPTPLIARDSNLHQALNIRGIPNFIVINKDGFAIGSMRPEWDDNDLSKLFKQLKNHEQLEL